MIRALSLHQPWADWVTWQQKEYETRSWRTSYRGWLLIHATQCRCDGCELCVRAAGGESPHTYGAIVGVAQLIDVATTDEVMKRTVVSALELRRGDWSLNRFAWRLTRAEQLYEPVNCRGRQRLWVPPPDVVRSVRQVYSDRMSAMPNLHEWEPEILAVLDEALRAGDL